LKRRKRRKPSNLTSTQASARLRRESIVSTATFMNAADNAETNSNPPAAEETRLMNVKGIGGSGGLGRMLLRASPLEHQLQLQLTSASAVAGLGFPGTFPADTSRRKPGGY